MKPSGICKHHTFTGNIFDLLLLFTGDFTFHTLQQIKLDSRRETSKSELSRNLKRTAQEKGFVISDNQGEGNCMFFALSEQLDVVKGMRISHEEIRQTVVHFLRENPTLVSKILAVYFTSAFVTVFYNLHQQTVITDIWRTIFWGDVVRQCCSYLTLPPPPVPPHSIVMRYCDQCEECKLCQNIFRTLLLSCWCLCFLNHSDMQKKQTTTLTHCFWRG